MFRILVADDEKITRRGIIAMLERGLREEVEYLEAGNGQEALEIARTQLIHLIVTDICMPLLSGLEFIEELQKTDPEMMVIIISGYENFEYAKQAVRLGVKDYIMKPVKKEEFLGLVERCLADIERKQMEAKQFYREKQKNEQIMNSMKRERLVWLLSGYHIREQMEGLKPFGISLEGPFLQCAVIEYEMHSDSDAIVDYAVKNIVDETLEGYLKNWFLSFTYESGSLALIFRLEEMEQTGVIEKALLKSVLLIEKYARIKAVAGVGTIVFEAEKLYKTFEESKDSADFKIYGEGRKLILYRELSGIGEREHIADGVPEWRDRIREAEVLAYFNQILKKDKNCQSLEELKTAYRRLCEQASLYIPDIRRFSELWTSFELRREVKRMSQCLEEEGQEENNQMIQEMIRFTSEHVTEDIDLNYIAEKFGRTPGYVGLLFRKGAGSGFNEYVTKERIHLAKNMLKDPAVSIQRVGELCGYHNPKYFSVVFKKMVGMTPKAYQKSQRDGK